MQARQRTRRRFKDPKPLDPTLAAERLKEVKRVFDELGVFFWLGSGTCLGAVREGRFIPWDDEMDTAGVIGMHGLTVETLDRVAEAFRERGFYCPVRHNSRYAVVNFIKDGIRVDWTCHHIVDGKAYEFPGVELPLSIFEHPREIEFIGEKFRIPDPPRGIPAAEVRPRVANAERARLRGGRRHEDRRRHTAQPGPQTPARHHDGLAAAPHH